MVMTMKLKYMGWVALSGLFAVSLAGCAAQSSQTGTGRIGAGGGAD